MTPNLSPHITYAEGVHSVYALRNNIKNIPPESAVFNMRRLSLHYLEPIRDLFDAPMIIDSMYRGVVLNTCVGGTTSSAHIDGRAADFNILHAKPSVVMSAILDKLSLDFDQLILEFNAWIHLGIARVGQKPRGQILMCLEPGKYELFNKEKLHV